MILAKTLRDVTGFLVWDFPPHDCEPGRQKRAAAAEAERKQREAWLRNPPAERIAEVWKRVQLPSYAPAGLAYVRRPEVSAELLAVAAEHRRVWLAGQSPERGVWVYGPTGARKTIVLSALLFDVAHRTGRPALCWNLEWLCEQFRRTAKGEESCYAPAAISAAELLLLDDLGTVRATEAVWRLVYGIVEAANGAWGETQRRQVLYVTSNESPDVIGRLYSPEERPGAGARIVRRLVQLCQVVEVSNG